MDYPIAHLKALLSDRAGLELSPIELAEILWLALQQGEIEPDESETPALQTPIEENQEIETSSDPIRSNSESAAVVTELPKPLEAEEVEESEPRSQESALPVKIPESVALRNRQAIARSIRPLMRKVASKQRRSIDEEATAIQIAETQTWSPVVQPDPERWLELAIVIEVTNLLEVWRDTIAEFQQLMERHGAFRTVRTWQLKPNEAGEPQLFLQTAAGLRSRARSPRELLDSAGRRLILLLSDCTSRAWRSGKIPELLELWTQENPVTIVQLLPESYWERSALSAGYPVGLKSRLPGALSRDWSIEGLSARQRQRLPEGLNLPVVTMQPESFRQWAKALSAMDEQQTLGVVLNLQAFPMPSLAQATPLTAKQLVQRFRSTASAKAQELADMMAVLPVNWSVIRLIQKNLLSESTEPTNALYLAEIFLSGLLCPVSSHYDFVEGVREVLLGTIPISEAQAVGEAVGEAVFKQLPPEVQERVNADISRRFGDALSYFEAFLIPDLPWGESVEGEILPFARVTRQVLERWGGEYAAWAEELAGSEIESEPRLEEHIFDATAAYAALDAQIDYFQWKIIDDFIQQEYQFEAVFPGLRPKYLSIQPVPEEIRIAQGEEVSLTILERRLIEILEDQISFELQVRINFAVELSYFDADEYHPVFNEFATFEEIVPNQTITAIAEVALLFSDDDRSEIEPELFDLRVEQPISIDPRDRVATIEVEEENEAIAWFRERQIEVHPSQTYENLRVAIFDRLALEVGDHYDVLAPLLRQMKRATSRNHSEFQYQLGEIPQEMVSRCVGFGHNLMNEGLLLEFHYDRATRTIRGTMTDQPYIVEFFTGAWFARYICQKVVQLLRERELRFSFLSDVTVTLLTRDRFELDLFFLVEGQPLVIECFTGKEVENILRKASPYIETLGIPSSQTLSIGLDLTRSQVENPPSFLSGLIIANRETYLAQIQVMLEILGISPEPSLPTFSFEVITVNDRGEIIDRRPGQASYYREELAEDVFLDMVSIPGGTFWMGAGEGELEARDNEKPRHQVTVEPFFMGKFAVTQAQWKAIAQLPKINRDLNPDPSKFKGKNRPVERISWEDAIEFCDRLNRKTGQFYRLPSEAEWEYACRAGTTTPFHFGETITPDLVNYNGNYTYANAPKEIYREQTIEVGSFPPNTFGLYEMHGNVWEWCADSWHDNYTNVPTDVRVREMENDQENRKVLRGGSWYNNPWSCRAAFRYRNRRDVFIYRWGLRVCK
ncbi:formylglycine-generating enzyme family protein [Leptolyngbya boryana CZ1]|uniref:Formylglycine-generating enzyme family protein n=1 Tax=Leptolyngbya boryana CZ1 TaxID=3060204 RepID=A0AA97AQV6_LEPBY|nr:formylglycine-generating enzyme family protein [Leptolyngbya boryana]WNZ48023.1 formylglycine-generating enzyme family protein [Leptolyngbya boryana CZ1]